MAATARRLKILLLDEGHAWQLLHDAFIGLGISIQRVAHVSSLDRLLDTAQADALLVSTGRPLEADTEPSQRLSRQARLTRAAGASTRHGMPMVLLVESAEEAVTHEALAAGAQDIFERASTVPLLHARLLLLVESARMRAALLQRPWGRDALTGLLDRQGFIDAAVSLAGVEENVLAQPLVLLLVNIERFSRINDALGTQAGDDALRDMANRLKHTFRHMPQTALARVAGDEFAVLLTGLRRAESAQPLARRLQEDLQRPLQCGGLECLIRVRIGIAADLPGVQVNAASIGALLVRAARASTDAKVVGVESVFQEVAPRSEAQRDRLDLEAGLVGAIERGELLLHYQPIVDPQTRTVSRLEALARWQRPDAMVFPGEFIPIAEETGMVFDIGEWAVARALQQVCDWRAAGIRVPGVSVNIHPRHLERAALAETVKHALQSSGLEAGVLQLEVTETGVMHDVERAIGGLQQLRELGVRCALDDFGTGQSSLAWLSRLPIDTLKIDRSFISDLDGSLAHQAVVRSIMALARSLGLHAVAEGVETTAQRDSLHALGCDAMQGYLYAKPMPAGELAQWWQRFESSAPSNPPPAFHESGSSQAGRRARGDFLSERR